MAKEKKRRGGEKIHKGEGENEKKKKKNKWREKKRKGGEEEKKRARGSSLSARRLFRNLVDALFNCTPLFRVFAVTERNASANSGRFY